MIGEIPNNVDLDHDQQLRRALATWHPRFLQWWNEVGPEDFDTSTVYLRTAVSASCSAQGCRHHLSLDTARPRAVHPAAGRISNNFAISSKSSGVSTPMLS